jgi:hypothetical protein
MPPNKCAVANRRYPSPLDAVRQFGRTLCAPPRVSGAVAMSLVVKALIELFILFQSKFRFNRVSHQASGNL